MEPKHDFIIVYEQHGRVYTYKMTGEEMQRMLSERSRGLPWRVWMILDGEMLKLNVRLEASTD